MSSVLLALSLLMSDDPQGLGVKARGRLESSPGVHQVYEFTSTGMSAPATVTLDIKYPIHQRVTVESGAARFEFLQSPTGALALDHVNKQYNDYLPVDFLLPMPPIGLLEDSLPPTLFWPKGIFSTISRWKVISAGPPAVLEIKFAPPGSAPVTFTETVDPTGKIEIFRPVFARIVDCVALINLFEFLAIDQNLDVTRLQDGDESIPDPFALVTAIAYEYGIRHGRAIRGRDQGRTSKQPRQNISWAVRLQ